MRIFVLICNFTIPLIMIGVGILYKYRQYGKINKILDLFMPIIMVVSGINGKKNFTKSTNLSTLANRKCSLIWNTSGIYTLLITIIVLILNKSNILNTFIISDIENISIILLEIELAIMATVFITIEYILKGKLYKRVDKKS